MFVEETFYELESIFGMYGISDVFNQWFNSIK